MKQSKVTTAQPSLDANGQPKSWQHQEYGLFYVHFIQMENGDKGEYNSKEAQQNKFVVGQEVSYEYIPNKDPQYLGKIKHVQKDFKDNDKFDPRSVSASYSKDIVCEYIRRGDNVTKEWLTDWFNHILGLIENKSAEQPRTNQPDPTKTIANQDNPVPENVENDPPF